MPERYTQMRIWVYIGDVPARAGDRKMDGNVQMKTTEWKQKQWAIAEKLMHAGVHSCLWGPPGVGKTYLAQTRGGYSLTCHDQMQVSEIIGHVWPSGAEWRWKDGPATLAFRHGKPLILNELGRCNPEVLDCMLGLLDSVESASLTLPTGEVIRPAEGYVAIATSNTDPDESVDPALRDRLISVELQTPHPALIERIASASPELAKLVARSYDGENDQISCRASLNFLRLRSLFTPQEAATLCFGSRGMDIVSMLPVAGVL